MSYDGVFEFYKGRVQACPLYGFKAGHEIMQMIINCVLHDDMLTLDEVHAIINLCDEAHIKMMEDNYHDF